MSIGAFAERIFSVKHESQQKESSEQAVIITSPITTEKSDYSPPGK
jgi:hypothetical protein